MPSTSRKQHNLMALVAHDKAAAKRLGISQKVGKEFMEADKGRKFEKGGHVMATKKMSKGGDTTMSNPSREKRGMTMEKMGKVKAGGIKKHGEHSVQERGHTKGKQIVMAGNKGMKKGGKVC